MLDCLVACWTALLPSPTARSSSGPSLRAGGLSPPVLAGALLTALLLGAALPAASTPARAQSSGSGQSGSAQLQSAPSSDTTQAKRFRLANSYMRSGQFERAIPLLKDLYAEARDNPTYYNKLKDAYENLKRYEEAIALVEARLDEGPSPSRMSEKARLLYLKGEEEAAYATWDDAVALAPNRSTTYRVVYQALTDIRRFDRAIDVLQRAREALNRPDAFRIEIAYLYSLNGDHRSAMQEYVAFLDENPSRSGFVRNRLRPFAKQGEGLVASIRVLEGAVRNHPLNRGYRDLLGWLHVENNDYSAAFDVYRAIDRLEEENGRVLFDFARRAADADSFAVASRTYDLVLSRHPDAPVAPRAQLGLGDMHRRWAKSTGERAFDGSGGRADAPHYEAAVDAYQTFLEMYPSHDAVPEVLPKLGHLQQDVFRRFDAAESLLERAVSRYPDAPAALEARYDLGRLALMRGRLGQARLAFSRLVDRLGTGDLAERARYELARLDFYEGSFDAALSRVQAINQNTSADVANDAIELKVLLRQNRGPDSTNTPLQIFGRARLLERQYRYQDALARLDTLLSTYGRHSLADEVRFRRASLLRSQGRSDAATQAFAELPLVHPGSPYADQSLFQAARLHEQRGNVDQAVTLYNRLLEDYPGSLLAGDARSRLRTLWSPSSSSD
jgi:tetratricopeptide (TPR) repeat protein